MLKRTITGACYIAIIAGFFLLREFVDARLFHILTYAFIVLGTFECARMLNKYSINGNILLSVIFAVILVPAYYLTDTYWLKDWGWMIVVDLMAFALIGYCIYSMIKNLSVKQFVSSIVPLIYPALPLLFMLLANDLKTNGFIALLLSFVVAPCADVFAYLVGMAYNKIKKGNAKKLCPRLSPKKTVAGAIGGIIGGMVGAIIVYYIFQPKLEFFSPVLLFLIIGLVASVLTELGDLVESYIKRSVGVKDSGKLLPGHGGILDRIDGMMFAVVFICIVFMFV